MEGLLPENFPAGKPGTFYKSCLLCPRCGRSCKRLQCKKPTNPGRFFFKCTPETDHKYFKWADEVRPHEFTQVPYCGGCFAGPCRVEKETDGPNAGRVMFLCRVKKGQGACGFRVWKDELGRLQEEERTNPFKPAMVKCNNTDIAVKDMEEEIKQMDEGTDPNSPFNEISDDVICRELILSQMMDHEVISRKVDQTKCLKRKSITTSSRRPLKRSHCGDIIGFPNSATDLTVRLTLNSMTNSDCYTKDAIRQNLSTELHGWWGRLVFHPSRCLMTCSLRPSTSSAPCPLESSFVVRDIVIHRSGSITLAKVSEGIESYRELSFNLEQEKILENSKDETTSNELIDKPVSRSIMSKPISNAFHQAAEHLQNELLTRLETMNVKDHDAMTEASEATCAALDYLLFDYTDLKKRAEELIHCARQLVEIDNTMPTNALFQKLVEIRSSEREKLDKINSVHAKAVEAVIKNKNRIKALQEKIFDIAAEVSCCEVELRSLELQLDQIGQEKELMEGKYLITSKKLEKSQGLIHCARQLVEINHTIPTNASYQKLVESCSNEREKLDKINSVHAKAVEAVTKNKNRIKALQEEIFDIAAEISFCEVEVRSLELQLDKICKEKELMEGKYLITSKELEKSQELLDQKEAEQNAAKAAFRRARMLLRG